MSDSPVDKNFQNSTVSQKSQISPPFKVHISHKKAFVWDSDVIHELRSKYRIVGSLIGTLPRLPMQNQYFGLPSTLMSEEVTLLLSKVDSKKTHLQPTSDQVSEFNCLRLDHQKYQELNYTRLYQEKRAKFDRRLNDDTPSSSIDKQNNLKSPENNMINMKSSTNSEVASVPQVLLDTLSSVNINDRENLKNENVKQPSSSMKNPVSKKPTKETTIKFSPITIINTSSSLFSWYDDKDYCITSIEEANQTGLWTWPNTEKEKLHFKIFNDLWNRGYFITNGIKFGGDYLLYQGDPLRHHGQLIASIVDIDFSISALDIITFGRLATNTKKSQILCSWDSQHNEAVYICLQWAGFD
ncbi:hypothetical protein G9A89_015726 [Geosiphon pyriformis]|nr:hypothetical protein G9A89_015726 [Geosiphon pyriformis]